ncbi:hypothetical protein M1M07_07570 [Rhodococcus sp. HM1]|uniref:hypothetical protein n=1 Tax=Rhodococcus sp. HM1 TaxID=2937759 RepID=UPI00200A568D|nr:hypothetical protein [Rhodococcus sp. HM1]MCK8670975.1 hypothetical protein [Rhodococcus sp. HM1]
MIADSAAEARARLEDRYAALPKARSMRCACPKCGGVILMRRFAIVTMREEFTATTECRDGSTTFPVEWPGSEELAAEVLRVICGTCRYEIGHELPKDAKVPSHGQ